MSTCVYIQSARDIRLSIYPSSQPASQPSISPFSRASLHPRMHPSNPVLPPLHSPGSQRRSGRRRLGEKHRRIAPFFFSSFFSSSDCTTSGVTMDLSPWTWAAGALAMRNCAQREATSGRTPPADSRLDAVQQHALLARRPQRRRHAGRPTRWYDGPWPCFLWCG